MKESGTKFKKNLIPSKIEKNNDNKLIVTFVDVNTNQVKNTEVYDTVLYATGRYPQTENIGLKEIGVNVLECIVGTIDSDNLVH